MAQESIDVMVGPGGGDGRLSKADRIHLFLKQAITRGELLPGTAIDKPTLCDRFGVSRISVNNAINRLAYEGLILIEPQKGSYVSRIQLEDVLQWMTARRAIEAEIAGEAARRMDAAALEMLRRNLRYQDAAIAGQDPDGFFQLDVSFHRLLTEGLGLHRITELLDALRTHLDRVRRLLLPEPGRMDATLAEHRAIQRAIEQREPGLAEGSMRDHLTVVMERLVAFERDNHDFFVR